jgi:hypothetical protein
MFLDNKYTKKTLIQEMSEANPNKDRCKIFCKGTFILCLLVRVTPFEYKK